MRSCIWEKNQFHVDRWHSRKGAADVFIDCLDEVILGSLNFLGYCQVLSSELRVFSALVYSAAEAIFLLDREGTATKQTFGQIEIY